MPGHPTIEDHCPAVQLLGLEVPCTGSVPCGFLAMPAWSPCVATIRASPVLAAYSRGTGRSLSLPRCCTCLQLVRCIAGYRGHDAQRWKRASEQDVRRTVDLILGLLEGTDNLRYSEISHEQCAAPASQNFAMERCSGVRASIRRHVVHQCERMGDCLVAVSSARLLFAL